MASQFGRIWQLMAGFGAKFGRKKEAAILALLTQGTIEKAAGAAGISPRTLYRWLQMPEFREAFHQAKHDAFSQSTTRLQQGSTAVATVLLKLALDPNTPPSVRVHAADRALTHARKGTEIEDMEARAHEAESDKDLPTKPHIELPGILRGMVENAVLCHRAGLGDPPQVTATEQRRQESDQLQEFIDARCMVATEGDVASWKKKKCWVAVADLYPTYVAQAAATGDRHPYPKGAFDERLHELGREKGRVRPDGSRESKQVWVWLGIRLNTAADD